MIYKSETLTMRLTAREVEIIDEYREGASRSAYLRSLIQAVADSNTIPAKPAAQVPTITDHAYPGEPPMVDQALVVESPATEQMPEETVSTNEPEVAVKKHFHKRGAVITSRFDKGVQITTYACAQAGCHHTMDG